MSDTYTGPGEFLTISPDKDSDVVARHIQRYRKAIRLANTDNGRWLDCACGSGYGSQIIPGNYLGVDRSLEVIQYAGKIFGSESIRFSHRQIENAWRWLRWLGPFDVILSIETLEHLGRDMQESWIELVSADGLTTDGVFVLACPIGNDGPSEYNRYHLHEPSLDGLNTLLSNHFKSVDIETEPYVDTAGRDAVQAFAVCR